MRRYIQQGRGELVAGWLLGAAATAVYLLTMEPTVSFWDCGEFIAVSAGLEVGHPPGAPFYQLLAHAFSWLACGDAQAVARCCNALSAVAGGLTVALLFWTVLLLDFDHRRPRGLRLGAAVGALCYLFCDTAWFSAVESEVYSLAMLIAAAMVWAMLRWHHCTDRREAQRWLLLTALLAGIGVCTHLLTLLTLPALLLIFLYRACGTAGRRERRGLVRLLPMLLFFFAIGLSPYLIIPIRASAGTPINQCRPATAAGFKSYLTRERYEKAPLYPRMWRHHANDALYNSGWNGGDTNIAGNLRFFGSYQFTYMYLRYLMWNFSGRYNDRQGYGSPQNGQFITGIGPIDRLLVGTAQPLPPSLPTAGHNVYYLLPLLLGVWGVVELMDRKRALGCAAALFLTGGVLLSVYLNHPCYEPRERDYAYILSFYAFALFIAFGAAGLARLAARVRHSGTALGLAGALLMAVPLLMAWQNWDDHDRSGRYIARDAGANILNSCDHNPRGTVLFCYGDNDTFPLWYLQSVEGERLDVRVENIGLIGGERFFGLLDQTLTRGGAVYFTHYAYNQFGGLFEGRMQLEGMAYRLREEPCDSVATGPFLRHLGEGLRWSSLEGVYVDEVGCKFLEMYWKDIIALSAGLATEGDCDKAAFVLDRTRREIPLGQVQDVQIAASVAECYRACGCADQAREVTDSLRQRLREQLDYYHSIPPQRQKAMPYTLIPREELYKSIR